MKNKSLAFVTVLFTLSIIALLPTAQAAPTSSPGPTASPGPSPTGNTTLGSGALSHNTTGTHDTAVGYQSMFNNTTGSDNSAEGYQSMFSNTTGNQSTAVGSQALFNSLTSSTPDANGDTVGQGTAVGYQALFSNTTGVENVAVGLQTLFSNTTGILNVGIGDLALSSNISGVKNIAVGASTLGSLTAGDSNTAVGGAAMTFSEVVNFNTALGRRALFRVQGDQNIGLGFFAGSNAGGFSTNDIYIGNVGRDPIGSESNTIRIGTQTATTATIGNPPIESHPMPAHTDTYIAGIYGASTSDAGSTLPVYVDVNGKLATAASSERFKTEIKPMDKSSEAILALKPVIFQYKKDAKGIHQFGLIAEEVAKVNPSLVAHDRKGEIYSVRYDAVNAMLLNEFLKEHRKVQELESARIAEQKEIAELKQQLKDQAAAIQKVSDKIEMLRPAPQIVVNDR